MRILVISEHYHPDPAGGQRVAEAMTNLAQRGHQVSVVAAGANIKHGHECLSSGVEVTRTRIASLGNSQLWAKAFRHILFQLVAAWKALSCRPYDVLVTLSTPPLTHVIGVMLSRARGTKHVFWCTDVHPDSLISLGKLPERGPLSAVLRGLNRWALPRCNRVVAVGRCMAKLLEHDGADAQRLTVIPMWHRDSLSTPIDQNELEKLRAEMQLRGCFVVMYSGNLGYMHEFETIVEAAAQLQDTPQVVFLFSGSGPGMKIVERRSVELGLRNVRLHPPFSEERLPLGLAVADLHIVTLRPQALGVSVPGKLYGVMAAGRPVVFVGPRESEVAQTIIEEQCGFVVPPHEAASLVAIIRDLEQDRCRGRAIGMRGRAGFEQRYRLSIRCRQFAEVVEDACRV